jgi:carbon starvation protein CstA
MNALLLIVVILLAVLFAAVSLYVAVLKLRQQAWSDAAIWIFAPLVVFGGLTMAAMGASSAIFLGLVLLCGGVAVILIGFKYRQNPTYVDDQGKEQTVAPAWIFVFFGLGGLLFIGGGFVLTHLDMFVSQ